ncbi:MAG: SDR family NAD(P)-dependent oxidoreductase [Chlorobi bacterium]|nr:SDR family NAD(P)-dependent oxidoreductase [Chlorobiota bacterium]
MRPLDQTITLVTGASSGIGRACAEVFAEAGSNIIAVARRSERLDELRATIEQRHGVRVLPLQCDVRDRDAVRRTLGQLPEGWRSIDIVINNAGLARGLAPIHEGSFEDWDEMIQTNLVGLLNVLRVVLPPMVERRRGMIINIGSIAGRQVYPNGNVYCATKHAVRAISEAMQLDLCGSGIRVTNIDPGMVETEFSLVRFHGNTERAASVYAGMTPLTGRDVAEVALFCATRPPHVSIHDVLVMPSDQASTTVVHRRT